MVRWRINASELNQLNPNRPYSTPTWHGIVESVPPPLLMMSQQSQRLVEWRQPKGPMKTLLHDFSRTFGAACLIAAITAINVTVLWGWFSQQHHLTSFSLGTATMKANSAVGFLLLALGLVGIAYRRTRLTIICGLTVMSLATITIIEHALISSSGIDQLLVTDHWDPHTPGRMAIGTAVSFALAGATLAIHHLYPQHHVTRYDVLLSAFLVIPLFVFFCYIFAPEEVIATPLLGAMPLHGCLSFLLYFFALTLLTQSKGIAGLFNRNTVNARNFRVLFFMVLIVPLCLGSVLNYGVQQGWIGTGIGIAIFCLFSTLIIAGALAHHTILLDHWFRQLLQERRRSYHLKNQIHELLEISADGIILFDEDLQVLHANSGTERILGYSGEELRQMHIDQLVPPHRRDNAYIAIDNFIKGEGERAQMVLPERFLLLHKNGGEIPVAATLTKKVLAEQTLVIAVVKSISALDHKIRDLEKQAATDALTQVSNRTEFEQYCKSLAEHGARRADQSLCVLVLDIDNFKRVNDSYGHSVGDEVLKHVTQATKDALREGDRLFRTGGEEFVIISSNLDRDTALTFAERIRLAVKEHPFRNAEHTLHITCSIGVSVVDVSKEGIQAAIESADQAMYQAKHEGKDRSIVSSQ